MNSGDILKFMKPNCKCFICNKPFYRKPGVQHERNYCSHECYNKYVNTQKTLVTCTACGKVIRKAPHEVRENNFCNKKCLGEFLKDKSNTCKLSVDEVIQLHEQGLYDYQIAEIAGCSRPNITYILNKHGKINRRTKVHDMKLRQRISKTNTGKMVGSKHPSYKGKASYNQMARGAFGIIAKRVLRERDYTCEHCHKRGGDMHVHHRKPFAIIMDEFLQQYTGTKENFVESITNHPDFVDETNLMVLCKECHREIHKTSRQS